MGYTEFARSLSDSGRPPWADSSRAQLTKSVSEMFSKNDRFRNDVMEELIKDCLHMEVAGIVSATFAVSLLTTFPAFVCSVSTLVW